MGKIDASKGRRKERHQQTEPTASPTASTLHPILTSIQSVLRDRRERRRLLLLTIPALLAQYFFWSWMGWSAIIMFP